MDEDTKEKYYWVTINGKTSNYCACNLDNLFDVINILKLKYKSVSYKTVEI